MILLMYNIFKNIKNTGLLTRVFYYVLRYNKKPLPMKAEVCRLFSFIAYSTSFLK